MENRQTKGLSAEKVANRVGSVFGELTVLKYLWTNKAGQHRMQVRCSCGVVKEVYLHFLLSGTTRTCRGSIHYRTITVADGAKLCSKCKKEKKCSEFSYTRSTKDGLYAWCKDCHALYSKTTGHDRLLDRNRKRRKLVLSASGDFTQEEFNRLAASYGNRCLRCGIYSDRLTADHVIPLSKGGTNTIDNIQPLCRSCNSQKGVSTTDYR